MIKKTISRSTFQEHLITLIKDEMAIEAIKDDGIYSTFEFSDHYDYLKTTGLTKVNLYYCKRSALGDPWQPVQKKIFYRTCPELGDVTFPYISPEALQKATDRIKMDMVKKDNAIWSTIKFEPSYNHFDVSYEKVLHTTEDPHLTTSRYLGASDLEIENTKRALRRIQENSYYGLYPRRSGLTTYAFDEKAKEDLKDSLKTWKASLASLDIHSPSKELVRYVESDVKAVEETFKFMHKKEEKEKTDMNVTLLVVPEGMSNNFVNKVKANFQSNNSQRLFVASTDIDYTCEHEPIKTKWQLFENWITTGKVDHIYFMLGFEKDPDVRAFEAFVRGITEVPSKVDVNVVYQKDDIENDIHHLRTLYFDEADAKEDAARATGSVVKEANAMKEVYSLDDNSLDIIKHSSGKIDASNELVINEIMDVAFAEDEEAKPKKGGKK